MIAQQKKTSNPTDDTVHVTPAVSGSQRPVWTAPTVTVVDLAEVTRAGGPGVSDGGIFS
jgi:hypothetical protein